MFRKVVFPTDFSTYANAVFNCLPALRVVGMEEVTLVHVIRTFDVLLPGTINQESFRFIQWGAEEQIYILQMVLEGLGFRVTTRIEYGSPARRIAQIAKDEHADLILVGAQGTSLSSEILIGSTAMDIIRHSPVPILLEQAEVIHEIGHTRCKIECAYRFTKILFPTDFSDCAQSTFRLLKQILPTGVKEIIFLHIQDVRALKHCSADQVALMEQQIRSKLNALCAEISPFQVKCRAIIRKGIPFQEVLQLADEIHPSIIALGIHGYSAWHQLFTGSTLENVVRYSRLPVLIVKNLPVN